jgi:ribosomal protein S18 acetylase RimI-like enzyme
MSDKRSGIVRLDPSDPEQVEALARLHAELLPNSVPSRLGHRFMTSFYFRKLPVTDLLVCDLYRHDGAFVGYCTYTKHPDSFLQLGLQRHLPLLCWLGFRIAISEPRRLGALADLLRKSSDLVSDPTSRAGFWLTFGVLEPYRRIKVNERARISDLLVRSMLDYFRSEKVDRVDGSVERTNKTAIFFYHACGFRIMDPGGSNLKIQMQLGEPRS